MASNMGRVVPTAQELYATSKDELRRLHKGLEDYAELVDSTMARARPASREKYRAALGDAQRLLQEEPEGLPDTVKGLLAVFDGFADLRSAIQVAWGVLDDPELFRFIAAGRSHSFIEDLQMQLNRLRALWETNAATLARLTQTIIAREGASLVKGMDPEALGRAFGESGKSPGATSFYSELLRLVAPSRREQLVEQARNEILGTTRDAPYHLDRPYLPIQQVGLTFGYSLGGAAPHNPPAQGSAPHNPPAQGSAPHDSSAPLKGGSAPPKDSVYDQTLPQADYTVSYNMQPLLQSDGSTVFTGLNYGLVRRLRTMVRRPVQKGASRLPLRGTPSLRTTDGGATYQSISFGAAQGAADLRLAEGPRARLNQLNRLLNGVVEQHLFDPDRYKEQPEGDTGTVIEPDEADRAGTLQRWADMVMARPSLHGYGHLPLLPSAVKAARTELYSTMAWLLEHRHSRPIVQPYKARAMLLTQQR